MQITREAPNRLRISSTMTLEGLLAKHDLQFLALFGSTARGGTRPDSDCDVAVMPRDPLAGRSPQLVGDLATALQRNDLDMAWLPSASWLLCSEVARDGVVLAESRSGVFQDYRVEATLRRQDSRHWECREHAYLQRFLAGRWEMNQALVRRKLAQMARYVEELAPFLEPGLDRFEAEPGLHYAAERLLELLVECAAAINTEVCQAVAHIPPSDYYSSFFSLAATGWISSEQAGSLGQACRMRNALVHRYDDLSLSDVRSCLIESLPAWRTYIASVVGRLTPPE